MAIDRVKPANWGVGDKLTSAEQNQLDTNSTYALDKRAGETDTLESVVSCSGSGRLIPTLATGADANTTYLVSGANSVIRLTSAITADRTYTLSNTNAVAGDSIVMYCETSFVQEVIVKDASANTLFTLGGTRQWASFAYTGSAWVLFQGGQGNGLRCHLVTAAGTTSFAIPLGQSEIDAFLIGGGGGGGGGAGSTTDTAPGHGGGGGGGGGGARVLRARLDVAAIAGTNLSLIVAAGGTAGAAGTGNVAGSDGGDGGDSSITGTGISVTARGAQGGFGGLIGASSAAAYVHGGNSTKGRYRGSALTAGSFTEWMSDGQGGYGYRFPTTSAPVTHAGQHGQGTQAAAGGTRGTNGTSSGTGATDLGGGGAGGGGGASEWAGNAPGSGGNGGNFSSGTTNPGTAGTAGTLGAGGGGGGGAAAKDFDLPEPDGGAGASGGPGAILLFY